MRTLLLDFKECAGDEEHVTDSGVHLSLLKLHPLQYLGFKGIKVSSNHAENFPASFYCFQFVAHVSELLLFYFLDFKRMQGQAQTLPYESWNWINLYTEEWKVPTSSPWKQLWIVTKKLIVITFVKSVLSLHLKLAPNQTIFMRINANLKASNDFSLWFRICTRLWWRSGFNN